MPRGPRSSSPLSSSASRPSLRRPCAWTWPPSRGAWTLTVCQDPLLCAAVLEAVLSAWRAAPDRRAAIREHSQDLPALHEEGAAHPIADAAAQALAQKAYHGRAAEHEGHEVAPLAPERREVSLSEDHGLRHLRWCGGGPLLPPAAAVAAGAAWLRASQVPRRRAAAA